MIAARSLRAQSALPLLCSRECGPSLAYVLSTRNRDPAVDPLFGAGLDDAAHAMVLECLGEARASQEGRPEPSGYTYQKPVHTRVGPIPRAPLPLPFILQIMKQLLDAASFMHGMPDRPDSLFPQTLRNASLPLQRLV